MLHWVKFLLNHENEVEIFKMWLGGIIGFVIHRNFRDYGIMDVEEKRSIWNLCEAKREEKLLGGNSLKNSCKMGRTARVKKIGKKIIFEIRMQIMDARWRNSLLRSCWEVYPPSFYYRYTPEEQRQISDRSCGSDCPYCTGKAFLKGFNDLATRRPDLAKEWSQKNLSLTPDVVTEKSRQNVWWKCSECGYEWKSVIWSRVKGCGCPVCADRVVLSGYYDLATTNRDLMAEWDNEKNEDVRPEQVSGKSMRIVWWKCHRGHRWRMKIAERTCEDKKCSVCEAEYKALFPQ